jgi:hypothetical protein
MHHDFKYGVYVAGEGHRHFATFREAKAYKQTMQKEHWYVCMYQVNTEDVPPMTYQIAADGFSSILCLICQRRSYNLNDVKYRYCAHCKRFHNCDPRGG